MRDQEPEQRYPDGIEKITIQEGWIDLDRGFFCLIERDGTCVEDFGISRRQALRRARKAWVKEKTATVQKTHGYPRVRECECSPGV